MSGEQRTPLTKMAQSMLGVSLSGAEARPLRQAREPEAGAEDAEEPPKKGTPWFLIMSIVVLVAVVAIAGYFVYKMWRNKREQIDKEMQEQTAIAAQQEEAAKAQVETALRQALAQPPKPAPAPAPAAAPAAAPAPAPT